MIAGIEHTAIATRDLERMAQWYVAHLGFVVNFRAPGGKSLFLKAPDGSMIELIEANDSAQSPAKLTDPGIRHMALAVKDFDAAYQALKAAGISFLAEKATIGGNTTAFFTDCDGNILHLLHRVNPLP